MKALLFPDDLLEAGRRAWLTVVAIVALTLMILGASYATTGFSATVSARPYALINALLPGKMHTYGVVMIGFSAWMLWCVAPLLAGMSLPRDRVRWALIFTGGLQVLIGVNFACAPLAKGGAISVAAVVLWPAFGLITWTMAFLHRALAEAVHLRLQMDDAREGIG